jgi:hypothetical protein
VWLLKRNGFGNGVGAHYGYGNGTGTGTGFSSTGMHFAMAVTHATLAGDGHVGDKRYSLKSGSGFSDAGPEPDHLLLLAALQRTPHVAT